MPNASVFGSGFPLAVGLLDGVGWLDGMGALDGVRLSPAGGYSTAGGFSSGLPLVVVRQAEHSQAVRRAGRLMARRFN